VSKKEFNLLGCKRDAMPQNATSAGPSTWKKGRVMHEHDSLRQSSWIPLRCAHDSGTLGRWQHRKKKLWLRSKLN